MLTSRWSAVLLTATLCVAGPLFAQRPDLAAFDRYVADGVRDWRVPGLAIAIVKDDSLVFAKGYGIREIGKPERVDQNTLFAIGSTTKAMTAALVLMLQDEGKLRLSDPVQKHLPSFQTYDPVMTQEMTVQDLLTHHTGLPTFDELWAGGDFTISEIMARMRWLKPTGSFRSKYAYQNLQYAVAGEVVRAAGGAPWTDAMRQRIFEPLGMRETVPLLADTRSLTNVATPHSLIRDTVRVVPNRPVDAVAPAGSVWSSVSDMAKWMRFVLDSGRVAGRSLLQRPSFISWLSPKVVVPRSSFYPTASLTHPHFINYSLGWFLQDYAGHAVAMHTGSIDGMIAIAGLIPDQRLGVYVLANLDHAELRHALMLRAFDLFTGRTPRDWSGELRVLYGNLERQGVAAEKAEMAARVAGTTPLPPDALIGRYEDPLSGTVEISRQGDALYLAFGKGFKGRMEHWHYNTYVVHGDDVFGSTRSFDVELDGTTGKPVKLRTRVGEVELEFHRTR